MTLAAGLAALAVGLVLGLVGSGGSIITVPVLVYVVGLPDRVAIASSLGIVGAIAAFGAGVAAKQRRVDSASALWFSAAGIPGTLVGARLATMVTGAVQLNVFASVMLVAAILMWRPPAHTEIRRVRRRTVVRLSLLGVYGVALGATSGFIGAGGGFLIVPALVVLVGLRLREAIGTSLVVIASNALVGFWRYHEVLASSGLTLDWTIIAAFAALGIGGSAIGLAVGARAPQGALRRAFAVMLLVIGAAMLYSHA